MTCGRHDLLLGLLEDALDPTERADVDAHLAGCAACRAALEDLRGAAEAVRALPAPRPSEAARGRALAAVFAAMDEAGHGPAQAADDGARPGGGVVLRLDGARDTARARRARGGPARWVQAAAVAACLLVVVALGWGGREVARSARHAGAPAGKAQDAAAELAAAPAGRAPAPAPGARSPDGPPASAGGREGLLAGAPAAPEDAPRGAPGTLAGPGAPKGRVGDDAAAARTAAAEAEQARRLAADLDDATARAPRDTLAEGPDRSEEGERVGEADGGQDARRAPGAPREGDAGPPVDAPAVNAPNAPDGEVFAWRIGGGEGAQVLLVRARVGAGAEARITRAAALEEAARERAAARRLEVRRGEREPAAEPRPEPADAAGRAREATPAAAQAAGGAAGAQPGPRRRPEAAEAKAGPLDVERLDLGGEALALFARTERAGGVERALSPADARTREVREAPPAAPPLADADGAAGGGAGPPPSPPSAPPPAPRGSGPEALLLRALAFELDRPATPDRSARLAALLAALEPPGLAPSAAAPDEPALLRRARARLAPEEHAAPAR